MKETIIARKLRECDIDQQLRAANDRIQQLQKKRNQEKRSLAATLKESEATEKEVKSTRNDALMLYDISLKVIIIIRRIVVNVVMLFTSTLLYLFICYNIYNIYYLRMKQCFL